MDEEVLQALRSRGLDVITVAEAGMLGRSDEEHLNWALVHNRVLYSFNARDFYRLHTRLLEQGQSHAGIILAPQQRYSVGEQMRGILRLIAVKSAEEMHSSGGISQCLDRLICCHSRSRARHKAEGGISQRADAPSVGAGWIA